MKRNNINVKLNSSGFSLVETMIAAVLILITVLGIMEIGRQIAITRQSDAANLELRTFRNAVAASLNQYNSCNSSLIQNPFNSGKILGLTVPGGVTTRNNIALTADVFGATQTYLPGSDVGSNWIIQRQGFPTADAISIQYTSNLGTVVLDSAGYRRATVNVYLSKKVLAGITLGMQQHVLTFNVFFKVNGANAIQDCASSSQAEYLCNASGGNWIVPVTSPSPPYCDICSLIGGSPVPGGTCTGVPTPMVNTTQWEMQSPGPCGVPSANLQALNYLCKQYPSGTIVSNSTCGTPPPPYGSCLLIPPSTPPPPTPNPSVTINPSTGVPSQPPPTSGTPYPSPTIAPTPDCGPSGYVSYWNDGIYGPQTAGTPTAGYNVLPRSCVYPYQPPFDTYWACTECSVPTPTPTPTAPPSASPGQTGVWSVTTINSGTTCSGAPYTCYAWPSTCSPIGSTSTCNFSSTYVCQILNISCGWGSPTPAPSPSPIPMPSPGFWQVGTIVTSGVCTGAPYNCFTATTISCTSGASSTCNYDTGVYGECNILSLSCP